MEEHITITWGYKFFRILLIGLVILGAIFIVGRFRDRMPVKFKEHESQLRLLDEAYRLRREQLRSYYGQKVELAPNEVLSIKYQQEQDLELENIKNLYFSDRQTILQGDYRVLKEHWSPEIEKLKTSMVSADETPSG